ncbi:MAG: hypothetical protein ACM32O_17435 [Clostridia bacterium]
MGKAGFQAERLAEPGLAEQRFAGIRSVTLNTLRSGYHFDASPRIGA